MGVSTAKIASAAGVSNGSLFNAYATKQALVDDIYRRAKTGMFGALPHAGDAPFDRDRLYDNWQGYIAWAQASAPERAIMHLLLDAGLVSAKTAQEINAVAAPHAAWIDNALAAGLIRGPSTEFIGKLILFQIDLVITENLEGADADLAFDMLCNSIGLTT